jgi:signal transduction histidine kinase
MIMNLDIRQEPDPLDPRVMQNLFRIFRTALTNVYKHAQATEVTVKFHVDREQVYLLMADNGVGFEVPADPGQFVRARHYGLFTMQSFAEAIGAKCIVESSPGKGTTVTVTRK